MRLPTGGDRFTPLVALDHSNGLFLDITGCAHLFGGEAAPDETLCQALTRQGFSSARRLPAQRSRRER